MLRNTSTWTAPTVLRARLGSVRNTPATKPFASAIDQASADTSNVVHGLYSTMSP